MANLLHYQWDEDYQQTQNQNFFHCYWMHNCLKNNWEVVSCSLVVVEVEMLPECHKRMLDMVGVGLLLLSLPKKTKIFKLIFEFKFFYCFIIL